MVVLVEVVSLSGHLCTVEAECGICVRDLKLLIEQRTNAINVQQSLLFDGCTLADPEEQPFLHAGSNVQVTLTKKQANTRYGGTSLCTFVDDKRYAFEGEVEYIDAKCQFTLACQSFRPNTWDWPWSKDPGTFSKLVAESDVFQVGCVPNEGEWCWRYVDEHRKFMTQAVVVRREDEIFVVKDHGEGEEYRCLGIELHKKTSVIHAAPGTSRPRFGGNCLCTLLADKDLAFEGVLCKEDDKAIFNLVVPTSGYYEMILPQSYARSCVPDPADLFKLGIPADVGDSCWVYHRIGDRPEVQFMTEALVTSREGYTLTVKGDGFEQTFYEIDVHKKELLDV